MITATRFHDFSAGHRVDGHEGKCQHLHGHNYRVHFTVRSNGASSLDNIGRVLDFGVINTQLCQWLEHNWDHRTLLWTEDKLHDVVRRWDPASVASVPFNPTAENMAKYLVEVVGPSELRLTGCELIIVRVEETRKCSAMYSLLNRQGDEGNFLKTLTI
jgi:6-pyruvoyltetrahydropterin/6-carboxytetrahydropterin synthase